MQEAKNMAMCACIKIYIAACDITCMIVLHVGQHSLDVNAQVVIPQIDKPQHTCTGTIIQTEGDGHRMTAANNATGSSMPRTETDLACKQGIHSKYAYVVKLLLTEKV